MIIFFIGNVGSGKTTLAKATAKKNHWQYIDADEIKKTIYPKFKDYKRFVEKHLPMPPTVRAKLYNKILTKFPRLSRQRIPVIVDETLHTGFGRKKMLDKAKKYFSKVYIIEIRAKNTVAKHRLQSSRKDHILSKAWITRQAIAKATKTLPYPDLIIQNNSNLKSAQLKLDSFLQNLIY